MRADLRWTGTACLVGGVTGAISGVVAAAWRPQVPVEHYSYPFAPNGFLLAQSYFFLNHLLLLAGLYGVHASGALGSTRRARRWLRVGMVGMVALALCELAAMAFAHTGSATTGTNTLGAACGVASLLIGAGLIVSGRDLAQSGIWQGPDRWLLLLCGLGIFVLVIPGLALGFLTARLGIGAWMVLFALLGRRLRSATPRPERQLTAHGALGTE